MPFLGLDSMATLRLLSPPLPRSFYLQNSRAAAHKKPRGRKVSCVVFCNGDIFIYLCVFFPFLIFLLCLPGVPLVCLFFQMNTPIIVEELMGHFCGGNTNIKILFFWYDVILNILHNPNLFFRNIWTFRLCFTYILTGLNIQFCHMNRI